MNPSTRALIIATAQALAFIVAVYAASLAVLTVTGQWSW